MKIFITLWTILLFISVDPAVGQTLISKGSVWKYLDDGSDQGTGWKETGFDDSAWKSGSANLKSGTIDAAVISTTTYFRTTFDYAPSGDETRLIFKTLVGDGAIIYINGNEVLRINMPDDAVNYDTYASSGGNEKIYQFNMVPIDDIVLSGTNVIAVELHNGSAESSDKTWDLELLTSTYAIGNISHIRFGSTGDPLNGLTIAWNGQGSADSIAWGNSPALENGEFVGVKSTSITGTRFEYTFPVLTAGSIIHYTIFDSKDSVWTEELTFKTASDASNDQFSFTVLGDSRSNPDQWGIISEATLETDFTLFMGDIISDGKVKSDWDAWFEYGEEFISREPIYHCVGNHDDDNSPSGFDNFLGLFTLPGNELYYSFTYGNALFICLNSQSAGDAAQYNWLLSTLEANKDQTWKIVFFHKPYYTAPNHTGEMDAYFNTWWKAFDDYGVDMIFNGHTHNYQRTKPINRNISTNSPVENYGSGDGQGRCQIVAGNAGAPLSSAASSSLWWLDNSVSKRHFCNIDIDGEVLTLKAMDANQVVFDEFELNKSSSEITFQVDLTEVTDLYDSGAVWLAFGAWDSSYVMTDTDGDSIYTFTMPVAIGTDLKYFFSYQNGADPDSNYVEEIVPAECGDAEGFRLLTVPYGNLALPAVLFGSCDEAPPKFDITFQVDLSEITDLYDGGAVWLVLGAWYYSYEMTDTDGDSIYTYTLPLAAGTNLKYFFSYQNGPDPDNNYVEESAPTECGDDKGYRVLQVPDNNLILPAFLFGSCDEALITEGTISIPITSGADDAEEIITAIAGGTAGDIDLSSSDLEIIFDHEPQHVGMLFRDVQIPPRANITNAYVQFTVDVPQSVDLPGIYIYGAKEATVDAITSSPFSISSHPRTTARVDWAPDPSAAVGDAGEAEQTPDISTIIEEIVAQDEWVIGNNILIVITGDAYQTQDINREFESYNGDASSAPVLNVTFGGTGTAAVNEIDAGFSSKVYPNPTQGILNIENPSTNDFSYEIYSVSGKLVLSRHNISGPTAKVDMSSLLKGIYILHVRSAERSVKHKVILQ